MQKYNSPATTVAATDEITALFSNIEKFRSVDELNALKIRSGSDISVDDMSFFKISSLTYDKDYPQREAFENVISSLTNPAFNLVYILSGTKNGVELYLGAVRNGIETTHIHPSEYSERIKSVFLGIFSGSIVENNLTKEEIQNQILSVNKRLKRSGVILGIPSYNQKDDGKEDFQGIDRLINSMQGTEWRLVIVCNPLDKKRINDIKDHVYELYNKLNMFSKINIQQSEGFSSTVGESDTDGTNKSTQRGTTKSSSINESSTSSGSTKGTSSSHTNNSSYGFNNGLTMSFELANKKTQETMKYIDEELIERIKIGAGKGIYSTAVYYMAKEAHIRDQLKSALLSLYQGEKSSFSPLYARDFSDADVADRIISSFGIQYMSNISDSNVPLLLSCNCYNDFPELATLLIPKEIGLFAGLPQHEVSGINLKQAVEFGLNVKPTDEECINIGNIIQRGTIMKNNSFMLPKKNFTKHIFIGGVTGSGKTVTCQKLLSEAKIPFWVIEPAKTEYRSMVKNKVVKDVVVFTMGNESGTPFRFNPFELIPGENIASHIDMIRATFTSAFPMEASMPQLLDEAIINCYEAMGWDISTNSNIHCENNGKNPYSGEFFPTLSELIYVLPKVVKEKNFGDRLQSEYIGSLISRISNLTIGAKGCMLDCRKSVDFEKLIQHNVIIEMEELKAPEDKALMMGFILSRLACVIRKKHKENPSFRHITLVEEAHRLLSRSEPGDNGAKKNSVDMFTDLLAEVRKYGEGLVIVDQIPNKLSVEVLKNTNTKIIHKLFAQDDKQTVGNTMLMDEEQQGYLSSLETGEAVIFTESTAKPMHVKISNKIGNIIINTDSDDISDEDIKTSCENIRNDIMKSTDEKTSVSVCKKVRLLINSAFHNKEDDVLFKKYMTDIENEFLNREDSEEYFLKVMTDILTPTGFIIENICDGGLSEEILDAYKSLKSKDYKGFINNKFIKVK